MKRDILPPQGGVTHARSKGIYGVFLPDPRENDSVPLPLHIEALRESVMDVLMVCRHPNRVVSKVEKFHVGPSPHKRSGLARIEVIYSVARSPQGNPTRYRHVFAVVSKKGGLTLWTQIQRSLPPLRPPR